MLELLAQQNELGGWAAIIGSIGVPGILMWYLWYRTAVADPKQAEENRKCHEAISEKFSSTVNEVVDKFDVRLEKLGEQFRCVNFHPPEKQK